LFLFGLATLFYPPLKLLIGSVTTSAAICAGGLALIILPTLVVGNELLILAGVASAVGLWFFAHRHGQLRGLVDATNPTSATGPRFDFFCGLSARFSEGFGHSMCQKCV
jgi:hypothetical protein